MLGAGTAGATMGAGSELNRLPISLCFVVRWEYIQESARLRTKKIPPSQRVIVARMFVVWVPKILSVIPPPKAAPRPSFLGRCMRTRRMISSATKTSSARKMLIRMDMRGRNIEGSGAKCKGERCSLSGLLVAVGRADSSLGAYLTLASSPTPFSSGIDGSAKVGRSSARCGRPRPSSSAPVGPAGSPDTPPHPPRPCRARW